jgi:hypothetical protein
MHRLIITDEGTVWYRGLDALRTHLSSTLPDTQLRRFVIEQIGFIGLDILPPAAKIELNLDAVSEPALAALFYWLADRRPERTVLFDRRTGSTNAPRLLGPWARALPQLARLSLDREADRTKALISCELSTNLLGKDHPLSHCLRFWRDSSARGTIDDRWERASDILGGRLVAIKAEPVGHGTTIARVGDGLPSFAQIGLRRTIGFRVEDQPDTRYGRTCANTYEGVLTSGEPRLERIDAMVRWPKVGLVRRRYVRLILPFKESRQHTWLLSATAEDASIDLRSGTH